jgi:hypothetical protein
MTPKQPFVLGVVTMSPLLDQALAEVKKLPESEQDAIASLILEELADERRWQASFARSQDKLAQLAAKARQDVQAGLATKRGFDEL